MLKPDDYQSQGQLFVENEFIKIDGYILTGPMRAACMDSQRA